MTSDGYKPQYSNLPCWGGCLEYVEIERRFFIKVTNGRYSEACIVTEQCPACKWGREREESEEVKIKLTSSHI